MNEISDSQELENGDEEILGIPNEEAEATTPKATVNCTNIAVIQKAPKAHPKKRNSQSVKDARQSLYPSGSNGSGSAPSQKEQLTPKKKFFCAVLNCPYSTPYAKDLTRHNRKHTGEKPYGCDRCAKSFSRYDKLRMHIRIHDGDRPYKCTLCEYAAVDSGSLKKHIRTHTDERPYKCQVCPYSAKDSSQLVVHLRYHTGDTPYVCMQEGCDAAFKTPSDLQRHLRLHTGEKPYACDLCDYKAAVKCNLKTHLKKYHKVSTSTEKTDDLPQSVKESFVFSDDVAPDEIITQNNFESECTVISKPKRSTRSSGKGKVNLPFHFACKLCSFKGDTMKSFAFHMKKVHSEDGNSEGMAFSQPKVPAKKRKPVQAHSAQIFECSICPVAFVREDSLRCHMRQHSDPTLHPPIPVFPSDKVPTITETNSVKGTPTFPNIPVSIANIDFTPSTTAVYQIVAGASSKIEAIRTEVITYNPSNHNTYDKSDDLM